MGSKRTSGNLAAFVWACCSILTWKISSFGYPVILTTRRTFFYGILFMVPALFLFDFEVRMERFADMTHLRGILYLGFRCICTHGAF